MIAAYRRRWYRIETFVLALVCFFIYTLCSGQKFVMTQIEGWDEDITIRHCVTDSLGYLWASTDRGIWRYDGSKLTSFNEELRSLDIRSIIYTSDHRLLLSNDEGLVKINPYTATPSFSSFIKNTESPNLGEVDYANQLFQDSKDRIWITGLNGKISILEYNSLAPLDITTLCDVDFTMLTVLECEGEFLVYGGQNCLYKIDRNNRLVPVTVDGDLSKMIRFSTLNGKLYFYGQGIKKALLLNNAEDIILTDILETETEIQALTIDSRGILYAGTAEDGLMRVNITNKKAELSEVYMANDPHRINLLPFRSVHYIGTTGDNFWVASEHGLSLLQRRYFETINSFPNLNTVAIYHEDDLTYVSVGPVYKIERKQQELSAKKTPMGGSYSVNYIERQGDKFWVSTSTGQMLAYRNERLIKEMDLSYRGGGIFNLKSDKSGNMWLCQTPWVNPIVGLAKLDASGRLHEYGNDKGLDERMLVVDVSKDGTVYAAGIGKTTFLYKFNLEQDSFINLSLPLDFEVQDNFEVHDMDIDERGVVWLATTDGLLRYDVDRYTRIDLGRLTETEIRSIAAISNNNCWFSTDTYGLMHYNGSEVVLMDESSGLPSKVSSYRCLKVDDSGKVWAGTAEGLVYTRIEDPRPEYTSKPILINVKSEGNNARTTKNGSYMLQDGARSQIISKSIEHPGKKVEYRYRTVDQFGHGEWISMNQNATLTINNPDQGITEVEIAAMNHIGKNWSNSLKVPVKVIRHWYQSIWPLIALALLVVGGLWAFVGLNLTKMVNKVRDLESTLANTEKKYQKTKDETIEDRQRFDLIIKLSNLLKGKDTQKEVIESVGITMKEYFVIDKIKIGVFDPVRDIIDYHGYDFKAGVTTEKGEDFIKTKSIGAYAIHHNETFLFHQYVKQHKQFISPEEQDHPYASQVIIPFELKDRRKAILHLATEEPNSFVQRDLEMFTILSTMIDSIDINREI